MCESPPTSNTIPITKKAVQTHLCTAFFPDGAKGLMSAVAAVQDFQKVLEAEPGHGDPIQHHVVQLVLGLAIPPLLASHVVGTRLAHAWFDVTDSYTRVALTLWLLRPEAGVRQGVLLLVASFGALSALYVLLDAPFVAAIQIIVYAGAIMVLFLFVIMLLGVDRDESLLERLKGQRVIGVTLGVGIAVELVVAIRAGVGFANQGAENFDTVANQGGNAVALSRVLFRQYFFPFEVTSVLLIVAAIAVVVLASRRRRAVTRADAAAAADAGQEAA